MSGTVIDTAGAESKPKLDSRREVIKAVRAVLRKTDSSDDDLDDALDALVELARDKDGDSTPES